MGGVRITDDRWARRCGCGFWIGSRSWARTAGPLGPRSICGGHSKSQSAAWRCWMAYPSCGRIISPSWASTYPAAPRNWLYPRGFGDVGSTGGGRLAAIAKGHIVRTLAALQTAIECRPPPRTAPPSWAPRVRYLRAASPRPVFWFMPTPEKKSGRGIHGFGARIRTQLWRFCCQSHAIPRAPRDA